MADKIRSFYEAGVDLIVGEIQVHAAEALLRRAGKFIDIANESGLEDNTVVEASIAVADDSGVHFLFDNLAIISAS